MIGYRFQCYILASNASSITSDFMLFLLEYQCVCSVPGMESFQPLRAVDLLVLGVCPLPVDLLVLGVLHEYMHAILVISHVCMPANACSQYAI